MRWCTSHRADPEAVAIADRHYNRQKIGAPQFVPPGRCVVLKTIYGRALWVTSWPFAQYVRRALAPSRSAIEAKRGFGAGYRLVNVEK